MVFKCKMCGGTLEFEQGATVGVCDSCGTRQTLPRLDDDKRANLYDRANHFRRSNDYDKAAAIYDQILNEDKTDAEAYWSLVLCRYGIEYVEDPKTHRQVPTVNRAQYTSIYADEDYKFAIQYADGAQRAVYEEEAAAIDEIQKGILEISQKEEPFDVFICYKETDNNGRRTQDSVLANDLYHQLTQEGFKIFFSRITLEDKLGTAYEPYIFAALNSARVMVVLGTKPEYFNAVWVKNEWSRYLALIRGGAKKMLIPAYRDMDPYDLPEEFSHLQAQDMSKLGFMQDLIRGIRKILGAESYSGTSAGAASQKAAGIEETGKTDSLLKRVSLFLEDGDWSSADEYCERVLDADPENAEAYLGKLMAQVRVRRREQLTDCTEPVEENQNYQKALRFADGRLRAELEEIREKRAQNRLEAVYVRASQAGEEAKTPEEYEQAAQLFESISGWKDAAELAAKCREEGEICRKDRIYDEAVQKMLRDTLSELEKAIQLFESISGWKDAEQKQEECRARIRKKKAEAKRREKICTVIFVVCVLLAVVFSVGLALRPAMVDSIYDRADKALDDGDYQLFVNLYHLLRLLNESDDEILYLVGNEAYDALYLDGDSEKAIELYRLIPGYCDKHYDSNVGVAVQPEVRRLLENGEIDEAWELNSLLPDKEEYKYQRNDFFSTWAEGAYAGAMEECADGNYDEASEIVRTITSRAEEGNYILPDYITDSPIVLREQAAEYGDDVDKWLGTTCTFGVFEQDGEYDDIAGYICEPISWQVLESRRTEEGVELWLLSSYVLYYSEYNNSLKAVTWEDSDLRKWLNEGFYDRVFSDAEKEMIQESEEGKVFLLSVEEEEAYGVGAAEPTVYAKADVENAQSYAKDEGLEYSYWTWCRGTDSSLLAPCEGGGTLKFVSDCWFPNDLEDEGVLQTINQMSKSGTVYSEKDFSRNKNSDDFEMMTEDTNINFNFLVQNYAPQWQWYYIAAGGVRPSVRILIPIE